MEEIRFGIMKIFILLTIGLWSMACQAQYLMLSSGLSEGSSSGAEGNWRLEHCSGVNFGGISQAPNFLEAGGYYPIGIPQGQTGLDHSDSSELSTGLPKEVSLMPILPSPGKEAKLRYGLPAKVRVTIGIYNILGAVVITLLDEEKEAGWYNLRWSGRDQKGRTASNGIYLIRLQSGSRFITRKFVLIR